jgi:hypothetical protein
MSAIADFRLIETSKLNDLRDNAEIKIEKKLFSKKTIDNYWDFLNANSKKLKDFNWSGYIFANLLVFLEEKKGIDLLKGKHEDIANVIVEKRQNSTFILTYDHRQRYLNDLSPDKFTLDELIEFNKDFSEESDPELAKAEIEGIKALRENLELLTDDKNVILLSVG